MTGSDTIWEVRDGFQPVDKPACGYNNEFCMKNSLKQYLSYLIIAVLLIIITAVVTCSLIYYAYR